MSRSRRTIPRNFKRHQLVLVFGRCQCSGHECQKQPLAGLLFSGISGSVGPDQLNAYLLPSVAAAVIGGTSILGGVGGYTGTVLGALILTVLNRLLLALDTTEATRQVLYGVIVTLLAWLYVRLTGRVRAG